MLDPAIPNALTVDVEDYFHVTAFDRLVCRSDWESIECRIEKSTDRLLKIFADANVHGTFFILGWVAEHYPELVLRIAEAGHEIASHGYEHQLLYKLTPDEFRKDIRKSRSEILHACGVTVTAYRAPSFSIVERSMWALEMLAREGFTVDSSIFPISGHDRYGCPDAKKEIHTIETPRGVICEYPPSAWNPGRFQVPIGGGYFRLFPLQMTLKAIKAVRQQGRPAMFYTHPWEIDPGQMRIKGLGWKSHFRHYTGLRRTERKLRRLLAAQPFDTLSNVIRAVEQNGGIDLSNWGPNKPKRGRKKKVDQGTKRKKFDPESY